MGCGQPGHQPASCEEWRQWLQESDQDEAMLARWLLHSTKNCPQCKQRIERDKGCLHVKCKCGFHFCWQCLRDWRDHDETTGGFFQCHLQVDTTRVAAVFTAEEEEGRSRGGGVESKRDTSSSSCTPPEKEGEPCPAMAGQLEDNVCGHVGSGPPPDAMPWAMPQAVPRGERWYD